MIFIALHEARWTEFGFSREPTLDQAQSRRRRSSGVEEAVYIGALDEVSPVRVRATDRSTSSFASNSDWFTQMARVTIFGRARSPANSFYSPALWSVWTCNHARRAEWIDRPANAGACFGEHRQQRVFRSPCTAAEGICQPGAQRLDSSDGSS